MQNLILVFVMFFCLFAFIWSLAALGGVVEKWIGEKYKGNFFYQSVTIIFISSALSILVYKFSKVVIYKKDCFDTLTISGVKHYPCSFYRYFIGYNDFKFYLFFIGIFMISLFATDVVVRKGAYKNSIVFSAVSTVSNSLIMLIAIYAITHFEINIPIG